MKEYIYRIVQRERGTERWHEVKTFKSIESARPILDAFLHNAGFFNWPREYALERAAYGEWEPYQDKRPVHDVG